MAVSTANLVQNRSPMTEHQPSFKQKVEGQRMCRIVKGELVGTQDPDWES